MLEQWNDLCTRLGILDANEDDPAIDRVYHHLAIRYCERGRHYHNLAHIEHCLNEFEDLRHRCEQPEAVELAIWFHDIVYDTHALDNEVRSAKMASATLEKLGVDQATRDHVKDLIVATLHLEPPADNDAQVMVDVDLSTLGLPPEAFARNSACIRKEYAWVPQDDFDRQQGEILSRFANREPIYCTHEFRAKYEDQARINLDGALKKLTT